jgi:alkyl hydroperoxide reductase subunit AhpC
MSEATQLQPGQKVPNFTMKTYDPVKGDFGSVSLEQQIKNKRWTVLVFYPADFTFVCATEFAALAERHEQFLKMGCDVVTVSTDTPFTHLAWQQNEKELANVKYAMAADHNGAVAKLFNVYTEPDALALRGTFVISPEGVLMNAEVNFFNLGRNMDELLRKVSANIFLAKNPADVCPAKWQTEGDKTLKPSAKMVGKVHEALQGK